MAIGKQIRKYRDQLGWTLQKLSTESDVDIGTISALEHRDSDRSKYFPAIAKAFGFTVEELADESKTHIPKPADRTLQWSVRETIAIYNVNPEHEAWLAEGIKILQGLNPNDLRAAVINLRTFVMNIGPPRDGQALSVAG